MKKRFRITIRKLLPHFAVGGMLFQVTGMPGCSQEATQITAGLIAGVTSSVINQLISDRIAEILNAPSVGLF